MKAHYASLALLLLVCACQNSPTMPPGSGSRSASPTPGPTASNAAPSPASPTPVANPAPGSALATPQSSAPALPAGLKAIRVSLSKPFLSGRGEQSQLTLTGLDAEGIAINSPLPLSFSLSRPQDFSISPEGLVTALTEQGFSELIVRVIGTGIEARVRLSVSAPASTGSGGGNGGGSTGVTNLAPSLSLSSSATSVEGTGALIRLEGSGTDPEGATLSYSWSCEQTACGSFSTTTAGLTYWRSPDASGTYKLVLTASDGSNSTRLTQPIVVTTGFSGVGVALGDRVWYVNASVAGGSGDGLSWANAFTDLQQALAVASSGDEIRVAEGTYTPGADRDDTFQLVAGVTLYGGFDAANPVSNPDARDFDADVTTLSGEIGVADDSYDSDNSDGLSHTGIAGNSYHVVTGADGVVLDGLTILGGNADGTFPDSSGAGLYAEDSDMILRQLSFRANSAAGSNGDGGAIYNDASSPVLSDVRFEYNLAANGGGAIANNNGSQPSLSDAVFTGNRAGNNGGAIFGYSDNGATLAQVRFEGNQAGNNGGGVSVFSGALSLSEVQFQGNFAGNNGGGIMNFSGEATLSDVDFEANSAGNGAGAFANFGEAELNEVSFENNSAGNSGGAINNFGTLSLTDCYFLDNTSVLSGGAIVNFDGDLSLNETVLDSNGSNYGGAIYFASGTGSLNEVVFSANTAEDSGGALYLSNVSPTLSNVVFSDNTALNDGGALQSENSSPRLVNVSFSRNGSLSGAGYRQTTGTPILVNTLFWQTSLNGVSLVGSPVTDGDGNQIDTQGNVIAATGEDPFVDSNTAEGPDGDWFSADDGLRLNQASLLLDVGIDSFSDPSPPERDILGVSRPQDADYDPGAYEGGFAVAP